MSVHMLKLQEPYFTDVLKGLKTFEIRKNDRDYQVGDILLLQLYPYTANSFWKEIEVTITYILKDIPEYGLDKNYCILGIKSEGRSNFYKEDIEE